MRFSPLRYAIYTRQSTATSAGKELSSCEVQFEICRDFMQGYGNSAVWIGERLDDLDETGADLRNR